MFFDFPLLESSSNKLRSILDASSQYDATVDAYKQHVPGWCLGEKLRSQPHDALDRLLGQHRAAPNTDMPAMTHSYVHCC